MSSPAPVDHNVWNSNSSSTGSFRKRRTRVKVAFDKTTNFATWCLFDNHEPSSDFIAAEQPLLPHSTTFLTGLRGIAALFVYHYHLIIDSFPTAVDPFISWHESSIFQLPVVRIIYAGGPMVALFFIISGFVLSIKPLRLARQGKWTDFSHSLMSSVFRRGPRLFLPCIPSTFVVMLAAQLHLFPDDAKMVPRIKGSFGAQLLDWMSFFFQFVMNIWSFETPNPDSNYGAHLWTIPFEFRDSMILFVSVVGTAALFPGLFWVVNIASALFCLTYGKWDITLFLTGMLFADSFDRTMLNSLRNEIKVSLAMASLFIGVYLTSLPSGDGSLWFSGLGLAGTGTGLILIMEAVTFNISLQRFLSSKAVQYLGDISFSLYILHEPILQLIGWRMVHWFANKFGGSLPVGLVCTWTLLTPIVFILSNLYSRYIEKPSVDLGRWLESRCFVEIGANRGVETELFDLISD